MSTESLIQADWPAPRNVRAVVTTRLLPGVSQPPFDAFNLGIHCGDDAAAVVANRQRLIELAGLPHPPHWLSQVHGVAVQRLDSPEPAATTAGRCRGHQCTRRGAGHPRRLPVLFAARTARSPPPTPVGAAARRRARSRSRPQQRPGKPHRLAWPGRRATAL